MKVGELLQIIYQLPNSANVNLYAPHILQPSCYYETAAAADWEWDAKTGRQPCLTIIGKEEV